MKSDSQPARAQTAAARTPTAAARKTPAERKARAQRIRELMIDEGCSRREAEALADAGL